MSDEFTKHLVQQVIDESILENITFYLLIFSITLVATAISTFTVSYLKKRGESLATKKDFQEVLVQLEQSTEAAEKIRSAIVSKFSREEERRHLVRNKLEELIELSYTLELWLEQARTKALNGESFDINSSPLTKIEMILSIYFSGSLVAFSLVQKASIEIVKWILDLHTEHLDSIANHRQPNYNLSEFTELQPKLLESLTVLRKELITKYKEQMGL